MSKQGSTDSLARDRSAQDFGIFVSPGQVRDFRPCFGPGPNRSDPALGFADPRTLSFWLGPKFSHFDRSCSGPVLNF